jgi:hypothetical protein
MAKILIFAMRGFRYQASEESFSRTTGSLADGLY